MEKSIRKNPLATLDVIGIKKTKKTHWNLLAEQLVEESLAKGFGVLTDTGALSVRTGKFTGRSPKDRFIVKDNFTSGLVDWNHINLPFEQENFAKLHQAMVQYLKDKEVYVVDGCVGADEKYRYRARIVCEYPFSAQFARNLFLRPDHDNILKFVPDWHVIVAPGFEADPKEFGTRQSNFAIINFTSKLILVGGTGYTGEIKKGLFSVMNLLLPVEKNVFPMHCSANIAFSAADTAIFFGLSGTGKTTLSTSDHRPLIGDDEHGWSDKGVFNIEGGCYAKCIDLTHEKEPQIYEAIKHGAILENVVFYSGTRTPDYSDDSITQNTRVSYPIEHIKQARKPSVGDHPRNIFFLTADAFGVLPPISRLNKTQAMFMFITGYTSKLAGTEEGIVHPEATFSACFGAPFMPLHPSVYAKMLGERMEKHDSHVWLINTGWSGGPFGVGSRIKLQYTREMIRAALRGQLNFVEYYRDPVFGLEIPTSCPEVPSQILNPRTTWQDKDAYDRKAEYLARAFVKNFAKFGDGFDDSILSAMPKVDMNE